MLAPEHRLTRRTEFTSVLRGGRRCGRRHLVLHALVASRPDAPGASGPRVGLIVSGAVGGSVVRHRVSRRLRHVTALLLPEVPEQTELVLRALPAAAQARSSELSADVRSGLRSLGLLGTVR